MIPNKSQFPWYETGSVPMPSKLPNTIQGYNKNLIKALMLQIRQAELLENNQRF